MPRRAKLIITALFLVLLAILATHLVLTWSPTQPLTFRGVQQHIDPVAGPPNRILVLEMTNRSHASIYLASGFLIGGRGKKGSSDVADVIQRGVYYPKYETHDPEMFPKLGSFQEAVSSTSPHSPSLAGRPRLIPPGETVRVEVKIPAENLAVARMDDVYVCCSWISTTRYSFMLSQYRLNALFQNKPSYPEPFLEFLQPSMTPFAMPENIQPDPGKL